MSVICCYTLSTKEFGERERMVLILIHHTPFVTFWIYQSHTSKYMMFILIFMKMCKHFQNVESISQIQIITFSVILTKHIEMHIWLEFLCGMENLSSFGCKQPLVFQYIYQLKNWPLRLCIKLNYLPFLQTIISLGRFWSFLTIEKYEHGFFTKVVRKRTISVRHVIEHHLSDYRHIKIMFHFICQYIFIRWQMNVLFNLASPRWLEHSIFHLMKKSVPLYS